MGRYPFFSIHQMLSKLTSLKVGQKVNFSVKPVSSRDFGVHRSISVYEYTPSAISSHIVYVVETNDYAPGLSEIGLKAFALKDPQIPDSEHIIGWIITSDGYIRETEHFTIISKLDRLEIIE